MTRRYTHSFKGGVQRFGAVLATACLVGGGAVGLFSASAGAEPVTSGGFEAFAVGSVNAQGGWSSSGPYDQAIVANPPGTPAIFGTKSLRISDGVTAGNFADQTYSKPTANQAGDPGAEAGGYPVGQLQNTFISSFDFASTTPNAEQPGLHMSVSPDRGDGARMSYVRIDDSPTGFQLTFDPYVDAAPFATPGNLNNGCNLNAEDGWPEIPAASDVPRGPHNLKFVMQFAPGPHNDLVTILLDGNVVAIGRSWEDYFRDCAEQMGGDGGTLANRSRTVRNLEFRESGTANASNLGKGFLIDNVQGTTISLPASPTHPSGVPANHGVKLAWTAAPASGGNPITGYVVTPVKNGVAQAAQTFGPTPTNQVISGLTNGANYTFRIAATNELGAGVPAVSGVITAGAPGRPGKVKATNGAKAGKLKVTFNAPMGNGSKITSYSAICKSSNGGALVTAKRDRSPVGVGGATAGKRYTCTVLAKNARGAGPRSLPSNAVIAS